MCKLSALARTLALVAGAVAATLGAASAAVRPPTGPAPAVAVVQPQPDVIGHLQKIVPIGSTIDPLNGDQNPYGLTIAPTTNGLLHKGDLVICNFNDSFNIQGLGTSIEVLKPVPGSTPTRLIADGRLTGCAALAIASTGSSPWVAAFTANDNPIVSATGTVITTLSQFPWLSPWGQTFSPTAGPRGFAAFYESNSNDGSIVRINLTAHGLTFDTIAAGFSVNHGVPGTVLAPSGLTYDAANDVLYIVDGNSNRLVAFASPGKIPRDGIRVKPTGFFGPAAAAARVVYAGAPLSAPISAALLFNGHVVVGNTNNNHLIEISPQFNRVVATKNLDTGAKGALFGIVATGTSRDTTKIYFNDDNENMVKVLKL